MKSLIACALLVLPSVAAAQAPSAEDLTRMLNQGPPGMRLPAVPEQQPAPSVTAKSEERPVTPAARPTAQAPVPVPVQASGQASAQAAIQTSTPSSANPRPSQSAPQVQPVRPAAIPAATSRPATATPQTRPATQPAGSTTSVPAARPPARTERHSAALSPQQLAALPFNIDLPTGVRLIAARSGTEAGNWTVEKGPVAQPQVLARIYAGPASQFPIYDGEQVTVAGRTSVVVTEGVRRIAMEHLFQQARALAEIHVLVTASGGADRDLAERIAQTVDPK